MANKFDKFMEENRERLIAETLETSKIREETNRFDRLLEPSQHKVATYIPINELYSAPVEWNFFSALNDDKFYTMCTSIKSEGLLSPITIWEVDRELIRKLDDKKDYYEFIGDKYMILAGHNRAKAYKYLYEKTGDEKYKSIPAFILDNIDEAKAEFLVVASNFGQRDSSRKEKKLAVNRICKLICKEKDVDVKKIAADIGTSKSTIYNELTILNSCIKEIVNDYEQDKITTSDAIFFAKLPKESQLIIFNERYGDKKDKLLFKHIKKSVDNNKTRSSNKVAISPASISSYIQEFKSNEESHKSIEITFNIPPAQANAFRQMCKKWISKYVG